MERKEIQVNLRLTSSDVTRAQHLAALLGVTQSEVFRHLLRNAKVEVNAPVVKVDSSNSSEMALA